MRILFLLSCLEPAGSETYCVSLAEAWKGKHEIFWISDRLHAGQFYTSMPIHQKAIPGGVINTWRVASYIRAHQIQLIHSHSRRAHWVASQAAKLTGIPQVTTIHQPLPVHFFSKLFPCLGDQTIGIDEVVVEHVKHDFKQPDDKVHLIRNGIHMESLSPSFRQALPIKKILLIGRLSGGRWKAFEFFLDVLERSAPALPTAHYKIVGQIPDVRREAFTRRLSIASSKMTPSTIEALGYVKELPSLLRDSDGAIAAGRSAMECLAMGRPTLLLGEGGVLGLCKPDRWTTALRTNLGDHLEPKDFNAQRMEAGLRELLSPGSGQQELSLWSRTQIETYFNIKTVAAQVDEVYQRALKK